MRKAKYVVIEGIDGSFKTTHASKLANYLREKGLKVLHTKEPGTDLAPLTMELRRIMLDGQYKDQLPTTGRELINQAIRSIHLEKVILPALTEYDYIIQDRGLLSCFAYGHACGNSHWFLTQMTNQVVEPVTKCPFDLYDLVIYMKRNVASGLQSARHSKKEFVAGDFMESQGTHFLEKVSSNMDEMVKGFTHCTIEVDGKTVDENFAEILRNMRLGGILE